MGLKKGNALVTNTEGRAVQFMRLACVKFQLLITVHVPIK